MGCAPGQTPTTTTPKCADSFRVVTEPNHFPARGRYKNVLVEDTLGMRYYMYDSCGAYTELISRISSKVPATPTADGTAGQTARDANYLYVCVATNTWRRVALATW